MVVTDDPCVIIIASRLSFGQRSSEKSYGIESYGIELTDPEKTFTLFSRMGSSRPVILG